MVFLLTGESGSGKTTLLTELAATFRVKGIVAGGFTAPGSWSGKVRSGFRLHDILNDIEFPLAESGNAGSVMYNRFIFNEGTINYGNQLIKSQLIDTSIDFLFIDEVGPLEMSGRGWAPSLEICSKALKPQLWVVRPAMLEMIQGRWDVKICKIFPVSDQNAESIYQEISRICNFPER